MGGRPASVFQEPAQVASAEPEECFRGLYEKTDTSHVIVVLSPSGT